MSAAAPGMEGLRQLGVVISDRGSKYAVSGGPVADRTGAEALLRGLKTQKRYARATHNSWAVVFQGAVFQGGILRDAGFEAEGVSAGGQGGMPGGEILRQDDGEAGAGDIIARMLVRAGLTGHIVVVTRWYGGVNLGGDRFRHVADCVRLYLAQVAPAGRG